MRGVAVVVVAALGACSSDSAGVDADTVVAVDTRGDTVAPPALWQTERVDVGAVGRQVQATVLGDGRAVVAAYADQGQSGGLCLADTPDSGARTTWTLSYYTPGGSGWARETVADILHLGVPRGFDLTTGPNGAPHIAALTGEPVERPPYCGAHDLGHYTRASDGTWSSVVVVAESGQAATSEPASDYGTVVGLWPALAFDAGGAPVIAYKDVHGGSLQADDFRRADLELAWGEPGGGYQHLPVDFGKGAGTYAALVFDGDDQPVILHHNPRESTTASELGLWVTRSSDGGQTWERVRLFDEAVGERPSMAVDPTDGAVWVAWYDGSRGLPYVAHVVDGDQFDDPGAGWEIEEIGDHVYDEGRHPSLAVSDDGVVGVAYHRCGRASDGIGDCSPGQDAVILAWRDGPFWEREVVDEGEAGLCGFFTTLAFEDGDTPTVFYQCQVQDPGGTFVTELRAARRREAL